MSFPTERADDLLFAAIVFVEPSRAVVDAVGNGADRKVVRPTFGEEGKCRR